LNEVKLSGRVLNCYIHNTGALITKVAVPHDHCVGSDTIRCESIFNTIMTDRTKIETSDVMKGDTVEIKGHLKLDLVETSGGNERKTVKIYADDIKVLKEKKFGSFRTSRFAYEA